MMNETQITQQSNNNTGTTTTTTNTTTDRSSDSSQHSYSEGVSTTDNGLLEEQSASAQQQQSITASSNSSDDNIQKIDNNNNNEFQIGDHIYQWCSFAGIPAVYQHHGIVMDVFTKDDGEIMLNIADFSNYDDRNDEERSSSKPPNSNKKATSSYNSSSSTNNNNNTRSGCIRTYTCTSDKWYKVQYEANWLKRHWHRSGTCTAVSSDAPGLVRARVEYLLENPHVLPEYNAVKSNCECVAVWCKTGTFATLQASSILAVTAAGQVKSAVTVAGSVAATQVTVPAAGAWGWFGYTTQVSLLSLHPYLLPAIAAYGVVTTGVPVIWLARAKQYWKHITIQLNTLFWEHAISKPEIFVDCITHWSTIYEPNIINENDIKELIITNDDDNDKITANNNITGGKIELKFIENDDDNTEQENDNNESSSSPTIAATTTNNDVDNNIFAPPTTTTTTNITNEEIKIINSIRQDAGQGSKEQIVHQHFSDQLAN